MTRLGLLLLLAVVASAMALVHTEYQTRRLFMQLEAARKEAARLEIDHQRLLVERRAQATPLRIEQIARQQLQMRPAGPGITQYVLPNGQVAPAVQAASEAAGGKP
ncbi:MAG: Cell division protein FtsL [Pseudomonadota bacterium]|jgi:cell division protein FtsL